MTAVQSPAAPQKPAGQSPESTDRHPRRAFALAVVRKLASIVITLLVTSFLVFSSLYLVPGDPVSFLVKGRSASAEQIAALRVQYGLDDPFLVRYWNWMVGALHGDFGRSYVMRQPVADVLVARLPTTLSLVALSGVLIGIFGILSGALAALRRGRASEQLILMTITVSLAVPPFIAAIVLKSVFSVQLGWFPTFGGGTGLWDRLQHLILPAVALSITYIALVTRVTRAAMLDELKREHVDVAVARGVPYREVIWRHVLRNALGPITTVSGTLVAGLLVSSSIVEYTFGLPGIGTLLVQSVDTFDFQVVQALTLLIVVAFVIVNTIVDLLYPIIDPRLRNPEASR